MANPPITIIKKDQNVLQSVRELWEYHELFYIFAWRDFKVRYKQTFLGVSWAVIQPVTNAVIFSLFFGNLAKISSNGLPYGLFVFIGLVFWTFFSSALSHASDSMVSNEHIIKKTYFPKLILPFSSILVSLVDFSINLCVLIGIALFYHYPVNFQIILSIIIGIIITITTASGLGMFLASFNVKYRDVRYVLPFFIQTLMFLTPVIYPLSIVAPNNRLIMAINPMTTVIELVRQAFLNRQTLDLSLVTVSVFSSLCLFIFGFYYFQKTERLFADIV